MLPKESLQEQTDPEHQRDTERRDRAMDQQPLPQPIRILQRPAVGKQTYEIQRREALQRMNSELAQGVAEPLKTSMRSARQRPTG